MEKGDDPAHRQADQVQRSPLRGEFEGGLGGAAHPIPPAGLDHVGERCAVTREERCGDRVPGLVQLGPEITEVRRGPGPAVNEQDPVRQLSI